MGQNQDPISKITRAIRAGGVALVVECLPSKLKAKFKPQNHIKKKKKKRSTLRESRVLKC
jgi:hypothetical protein